MPTRERVEPGTRFNRLTILSETKTRHRKRHFIFRCDCGNKTVACLTLVKRGITKSCGCLRKEKFRAMITKHGHSRSRLNMVWRGMKQRCTNRNHKDYVYYGERGIKVSKGWLDFKTFMDWAIGAGYQEGLTIERINNDGDYEPSNCKWIPQSEQYKNTRRNVEGYVNGLIFISITEAARHYGIPAQRAYDARCAGKKNEDIFK